MAYGKHEINLFIWSPNSLCFQNSNLLMLFDSTMYLKGQDYFMGQLESQLVWLSIFQELLSHIFYDRGSKTKMIAQRWESDKLLWLVKKLKKKKKKQKQYNVVFIKWNLVHFYKKIELSSHFWCLNIHYKRE